MLGDLDALLMGLQNALTPVYLLYALAGAILGTLIGMLPGLGPTVTMAMLLPVAFAMGDPIGTIVMFGGIFFGSMYGGATTAILLGTPGESSAVVTRFEGYPMGRAGRAGAALLCAAVSSFLGGTLAVLGLALVARPLVQFALQFGPAEYFAIMLLAVSLVSLLAGKFWKGLFATLFGLALGTVGTHQITGQYRFTYGQLDLLTGLDIGLIAIGLFAVSEVLFVLGNIRNGKWVAPGKVGKLYMTGEEWRRSVGPWARGSVLGFIVGALPGAGGTIGTFISYATEKRISRRRHKFGTGMIEGLAGPEASNNAASGGSMVPMLTLGIPGSAATAMMLGALHGFGVQTGPLLMRNTPDLVWTVIAGLLIGNVMLLILNVPLIGLWVKVLSVPSALLYPIVLAISTIGVYTLSRSTLDLYILFGIGIIGFLFRYCGIPLAPTILAAVLGSLLERQWTRALTASQGDWGIFFDSTISVVVLLLAALMLVGPVLARLVNAATRGSMARRGGVG